MCELDEEVEGVLCIVVSGSNRYRIKMEVNGWRRLILLDRLEWLGAEEGSLHDTFDPVGLESQKCHEACRVRPPCL